MKVIFMGTPDFAVPVLEELQNAGHEILLAVTQPDKPKGRGKSMSYSPVKEKAVELGIPVFQPIKIREEDAVKELSGYPADVIVVVAFGQILPKEILKMPRFGCINVHASLLPKYRGAAPIQWAVINGEKISGVTTMQMDIGLDTGDILLQEEVALEEKETGGSLFDKLSIVGAGLCVKTLERIEKGDIQPIPQSEEEATLTKQIKKDFGHIDWKKSAKEIECLLRGLNPWPSAFAYLKGKTFKIWDAQVVENSEKTEAGRIIRVSKKECIVACGKDALSLKDVQLEGKKRMPIDAFLRGYPLLEGEVLN